MAKNKFMSFLLEFLEAVEDFDRSIQHFGRHHRASAYRDSVEKGFYNLQQRGLIKMNGDSFKFTKNGLEWYKMKRINNLKLRKSKWDKKWRLVVFDIPEELHNARNALRKKMKNLDFYMLQKSIFVFPFPCENEISVMCNNLNISDYVDIIIAQSIGGMEEIVKRYYKL